ncbi:MAG: endonuclease/exonuclease/phosphatase family protein [Bacteroidales bacterium]|nr:endonuclease/exonuclease/phosphatase family protein [Bacteroidales bacterium]
MKISPKLLILTFLLPALLACSQKETELSVMSFNIRYDNPADGLNAWPNRIGLVEDYLRETAPDIVGFQEALHHQVKDIETMMPAYVRVGTGRDDGLEGGEYSPIFFKEEVFDLLGQGQFWLSKTPDVPGSIGPGAVLPRIATWAHLHIKKTGRELFVFNTHYSHVSDEARWLSAQIMSERMHQIAGSNALIVTGDFNLDIESETYQRLAELFLKENQLTNATESEPTYALLQQGTYNGFGHVEIQPFIDFIFVSPHFQVISSSIDRIKPGNLYISDHWPVVVKFKPTDFLH